MSNGQPKKLNLALYLDPVTSDADRAAMDALQQWYEDAKLSHGEQQDADMSSVVRLFHRDIYLAGLRLYLINPTFCRQIANALAQQQYSVEMLVQQGRACGLLPLETSSGAGDSSFSEIQLEQLERLLGAYNAEPRAGATTDPESSLRPTFADEVTNTELGRQLAEQGEQLTALMAELQRVRALAEQQAAQLKQLKGGGGATASVAADTASDELSVAEMAPPIAQRQKDRRKGVF